MIKYNIKEKSVVLKYNTGFEFKFLMSWKKMIMIDRFQVEDGNNVVIVDKQTDAHVVSVCVSLRRKDNIMIAQEIIDKIIVPYFENGENYETD